MLLKCSLQDSAIQILWEFNAKADITYDELIKRLRQRYGSVGRTATHRNELHLRKQKENESLRELMSNMKRQMYLAYPDARGETANSILCDAFINALSDRTLARKIRELEPSDIETAYHHAIRLEAYKDMYEEEEGEVKRRPHILVRGTLDDDTRDSVTTKLDKILKTQEENFLSWKVDLEAILTNLEKATETVPGQRNDPPKTTSGPSRINDKNLYSESPITRTHIPALNPLPTKSFYWVFKQRLNDVGGSPRNVSHRSDRGQHTPGRGRPVFNKASKNSSPNVCVEEAKSFYLKIWVNGTYVHGLIDTGSQVCAKRRADRYFPTVKACTFIPGQKVWYFTPRRYRGRYQKWNLCYTGPYSIISQKSLVTYEIALVGGDKSFVVHVDKLKRCRGQKEEEPGKERTEGTASEAEEGEIMVRVDRPDPKEEEENEAETAPNDPDLGEREKKRRRKMKWGVNLITLTHPLVRKDT